MEEELQKRAYRLGFEVGFHSHDEWTSWVWGEKRRIFSRAKRLGMLKEVEAAYERGKREGVLKRRNLPEKKIAARKKKMKVIEKPSVISRPDMSGIIKTVVLPKFLRLFK